MIFVSFGVYFFLRCSKWPCMVFCILSYPPALRICQNRIIITCHLFSNCNFVTAWFLGCLGFWGAFTCISPLSYHVFVPGHSPSLEISPRKNPYLSYQRHLRIKTQTESAMQKTSQAITI